MNTRGQPVLIFFIVALLLFVNFSYTAQDVNIFKRIKPHLLKIRKAGGNKMIVEVKWDGTGIKDDGMICNKRNNFCIPLN